MEGGDELVALPGSHNLSVHLGKHLSTAPHLLDVRRTDESHGDVALDSLHRSLYVETAELSAVGVPQRRDVHGGDALAWLALYLLGEKNQAGAGAVYRKPCGYRLLHRFHQTEFVQELRLGGTLTTGNDETILGLVPVLPLANLETVHAQPSQLLPVLGKGALQCQYCYSHFYFPLSAMSSAISCSLIPTIASPRSSLNSANILGSL